MRGAWGFVSAVLLVLLGLARISGAQMSAPASGCMIAGTFTVDRIRVRTIDGVPARHPRVALDHERATLEPVRRGLYQLHGILPDGRAFSGTVRHLPALEIAADVALPGLVLGAGVAVLSLEVRAGHAVVDLDLGGGLFVREYAIECRHLGPVDPAAHSGLAFAADVTSPRRTTIRRDLTLRPESGPRIRLRFTGAAPIPLFERERRGSEVRVAIDRRAAHLEGWVENGDLTPAPPLDSLGHPRAD